MSALEQPTLEDVSASSLQERAEEETRINVRLTSNARKALDWIAAIWGVSRVEAIRKAIGTEKFFLELREKNAKIFVQMPGENNLKQVIFKS